MLDRTFANYFAATLDEVSKLENHDEVYDLMLRYENSACFELSAFLSLTNLHFGYEEKEILNLTDYKLKIGTEIYRCNQFFVDKFATLSEEETDTLAYKWRETFWEPKNLMYGLGIWSHLFSLKRVCEVTIKENKNLFVVKDYVEPKLER